MCVDCSNFRFDHDYWQIKNNTYFHLTLSCLTELERSNLVDCIKGSVWSSVQAPEFDTKTHEEGWRTHRPKHCEYNDEDGNNSPNILGDKNFSSLLYELGRVKNFAIFC